MISIAASENTTSAGDQINFLRIVANINGCKRTGAVFFKPKETIIADACEIEVGLVCSESLGRHFAGVEGLIAFLEELFNGLTFLVGSIDPGGPMRFTKMCHDPTFVIGYEAQMA